MKPATDTRRQFLRSCLRASGASLIGFEHLGSLLAQGLADTATEKSSFQGGRLLGLVDFSGESQAPLDTLFGTELRVEKWLVNGKIKYRVVGILWGGTRPVKRLEIWFNPEEDYIPVSEFSHASNDPWTFWYQAWEPKAAGRYMIRLRVADPRVTTKRLDAGYYLRMVEITEI